MADLKVSELESANVVQRGDLLYIVQDGTSKNVNAGILFASLSDPRLAGNVQLGGNVQVLSTSGVISLTVPRTELIGGNVANTTAITDGTALPATIFMYTPNVSGTGLGFTFTEGVSFTKNIVVSYANNKIKLNGYFPNEWAGSGVNKPFPSGLTFVKGANYVFNVSDPTNIGNTLSFSTSIDGTNTLGTEYTANVVRNGTAGSAGANITFIPANVRIDDGGLKYIDIAKGTDGQLKIITLTSTSGGSYSLSSNILNNLNIKFTKSGETAFLMYSGNAWILVGATPGFQTTFSGTSDDVPEGSKLYFTNARARAAISAFDNSIIYDSVSGTIKANAAFLGNISISSIATTDEIPEGPIALANLNYGRSYFTNARAIAAVTDVIRSQTANLNAVANITFANVANVIYVTCTGNDANDGRSIQKPLANIHTALARSKAWDTIKVSSGQYVLYNQPVTIPTRVSLVGDSLRTTSVYPYQANVDMFYVNNGCYVTGFTFRNHVSPAAVFSYNPNGSAGFIVTSPYIQNCSSITTTGCGMRVNGNYVSGLRSMVVDSYTQTNEGGIGIHMLNRGYTQLVSVFTICCNIAILCENGGFCSITNSNSSFGTYGLVARGVSFPLYFGTLLYQDGNNLTLGNLNQKPNYGDAVLIADFDQSKCSRDTGLIVDALLFDLAYNGNTEATFAGLQYFAQSSSAIPGQATETINALNYAKRLATNVILNIAVTPTYQLANSQVIVAGPVGGQDGVYKINNEFYLITDIIQNGTVGVTDRIIPNKYPANSAPNINLSANILYANKNFIQSEVVAYVANVYPAFSFNTAKCFRDVGYIIDSIVFDLRHDGNKQAITSGVYYYNFNANVSQINNQVVQTRYAYNYIGSLVTNLIQNKSVANYNEAKCRRDTGLIVDSLVIDLAYQSNTQAVFAGLQYWAQSSSAIPGQATETIAAIGYAKNLATNVLANVTITNLRQTNVAQVRGLGGTAIEKANVATNFDLVANIIGGGTVGVTDRIISNRYPKTANATINNAANLLYLNNTFISSEVVAFVNQTYPSFTYNANTCARDVGFIVDSIVFDLRHGGNRQSIMSGVYYYNFSASNTQINDQIVQTGEAYRFIGSIIDEIVTANTITRTFQTAVTQNTTAAPAATTSQSAYVATDIDLIANIITNGPNVAPPRRPITYKENININDNRAALLIDANRQFIIEETIGYVNSAFFSPPYQDAVKQNTNSAPASTTAIANVILNNINLITNIISNGPSVAPEKKPISLTANTEPNVINAAKILYNNRDFIKAEVLEYTNQNWANLGNNNYVFYTVNASTPLLSNVVHGNTSVISLLETINDTFRIGTRLSFHQPSYISGSGHTFEYVGAGDSLSNSLPFLGGVPIQENEVISERGGSVYYTSTDHKGDFRIGDNLLINRTDGTISGRTFVKALFATMTPYILALEG